MFRLWIVNHYAGGPGIGTGWRHWELARRWRSAGIDVRIIAANVGIGGSARAEPGERDISGVPFHFLPCPTYAGNGLRRAANLYGFQRQIAAALPVLERRWSGAPDCLLASSPQPLLLSPCAAFCRSRGIRLVVEFRDLWPESLIELTGMSKSHPFAWWCARAIRQGMAAADTVVSPLEGIDRYLRDAGLPRRPTLVVPNGVDLDGPVADRLPDALEHAVGEAQATGRFIVLYAGALGVPNAMRQLFEAAALLKPSVRERIALVVIGEGTQRHDLERRGKGLAPSLVTFAGQQPETIVRLLARHCHVGFIGWLERPLYQYGTSPQKVPLMLAAGLPVIEAAPSCRAAYLPAEAGWTCRAERPEELAAVLASAAATQPGQLAEMRFAAAKLAQRLWGWEAIAKKARIALDIPTKGVGGY